VQATVTAIRHKIDINTLDKTQGHSLGLNEIGFCNISTSQPIAFDPTRRSARQVVSS
jgi:bifunctional enzyme CysN/CysC